MPMTPGLDVFDQRGVAVGKGTGGQGQVFEAHARQHADHEVNGLVALAEGVMEGDGLAIAQSRAAHCLFERVNEFAREFFRALEVRRGGSPNPGNAPALPDTGLREEGRADCRS